MAQQEVLVTGGSGFVAGHVVLRLLDEGHRVRTTVRSLRSAPGVRDALLDAGMTRGEELTFVEADLLDDGGWADAVAGTDAVLHVASPVRPGHVADEDEVIRPAREGTLRVLRAARDAGVRRVVLTSAFHAVGFGQPHDHGPFTEADWSPLDGEGVDAYGRSKILAERAAWDLAAEGNGPELVALLPVAVLGPVLGGAVSGGNHVVQNLLRGAMPALPDLFIPIVDVRDVALAHVAALRAEAVAGQRVLVSSGEPAVAMRDIALVLKAGLGRAAARVPTRRMPDVVVRASARFRPELRSVAADLGFVKEVDITRMRTALGIEPRPAREAILAAGRSLVANGLV
ncbi:NAD-dependent epimerase/dehydratase family protein [Amnibacterium sp. CER49]|uniref:NAD-dependent epimerase/dehydratase family protein n=1 Tax=Amnibacterium sp. CER49 TaxID=3039161 RepID=UPI00244ACB52|nr:NAD-dependent epimerase/dehydratase family protein [Amnibacterium sp. CER49]MDH2442828.1 NAD-dependent epimerase/dehydratase family protein [Amnibacterium sp. CER49]